MLKDDLLQGYAPNEKRLKEKEQQLNELQKAVEVVSAVANRKALSSTEATGILEVLNQYSHALQVLDEYDHQQLKIEDITEGQVYELTYEEAVRQIDTFDGNDYTPAWKKRLPTCFIL